MKDASIWWFALFAVCGLLLNVPAGLLLDQLLKYEYRFRRDAWDADGRPSGFLWCPRDAEWLYTSMNPFAPPLIWLFRTPQWIRSEPALRHKLNIIRLLNVVGTTVGLFFLVFIFKAI